MNKVTYFFSGNRKDKIKNKSEEAKELYYSYHEFDKEKLDLEIIEFTEVDNLFYKFLYYYDRLLNKCLSLPSYSHKIFSVKNYKSIKQSDLVFLVNEGVAFSVLPMLFFIRRTDKTKINVFSMGLFSKEVDKKYMFIHRLFIKLLIANVDNLLFLGKGEMELAKTNYKDHSKFKFIGFSVDTDFWISNKEIQSKKPQLLFVGNDSNKSSITVVQLAEKLPEFNIICVSKLVELHSKKLTNLTIFDGAWNDSAISDQELKEMYEEAFLTIVPLRESSQPSGQSVTMQSMITGTPVLITDTKGFWDKETFLDNENIFLIENNDVELWVEKIRFLYNNQHIMKTVSKNGKNLIHEKYNLKIFHKRLKSLISN
jgi:glycosyltransferase involved in cell wall biosynthesis